MRRRRTGVSWLPHIGQGAASLQQWLTGTISAPAAVGTAGIVTTIHALIPDFPAEAVATAQPQTLADYTQSGYRLRRIVGKFFAARDQQVPTGQPPQIPPLWTLLGVGFIILRVDSGTGSPLAASAGNYSPLLLGNERDPWIWRRTWMLSNRFADPTAASAELEFPSCTPDYGSIQDGPHIDAKSVRRVGPEERLFMVVSTAHPGDVATDVDGYIRYTLDYRVLGNPIKMTNRRNASR